MKDADTINTRVDETTHDRRQTTKYNMTSSDHQQKPWSVDYFERMRPHMTNWVKQNLLPYINSRGHSKISIKAPVKSGKREIVEYVAQRDSVSGNQERVHIFVSSWHRTADADQRVELGQQNLKVFSTTSHKKVEACKVWINERVKENKIIVVHLDECDYATAPLQILSNLWSFIRGIRESAVKVILYSATPEEVIYASARSVESLDEHELLHDILVTTQLTYVPSEGYCGSGRFLQEGLVTNALPFFEKIQQIQPQQLAGGIGTGIGTGIGIGISNQGRQIINDLNESLQVNPERNCIVLRLSYSEGGNKTENKAFHTFINNVDKFSELHGFSIIYDKTTGCLKPAHKSTAVSVRADRIEWSERAYWDDLAEGPRRKYIFVIDQTSSRSTEWACHHRIFAYHDFRHTVQYTTVAQAQERVNHYTQRYGNEFQRIKVYGHLPTFQLSAGLITYDRYFEVTRMWVMRKISIRHGQCNSDDAESVSSSQSVDDEDNAENGDAGDAGVERAYIVRERVSKIRHPDCPETGMDFETATRLLQQLGCCKNTSISSRVVGNPKQVPEYKGTWYECTKEGWDAVWDNHCASRNIQGITRSRVRNPFENAESKRHPDGRWRGQHRGWRVLRWVTATDQLFDVDDIGNEHEARRIEDLGSTGGERNKVCYNESGVLGILIVEPTGNYITKNKLVSVNTMYMSN